MALRSTTTDRRPAGIQMLPQLTIFLIAPDLRTLGGFEAQMSLLAGGLCRSGCHVTVLFRVPVHPEHPYRARMQAAGVHVVSPSNWIAQFLDPARFVRDTGRSMLVTVAVPLLALLAVVHAALRRRPLRRTWRGAVGRWHGLVSRTLFADVLTWRLSRALDSERRRRTPDIIDVQHSMIPYGITYAKPRGIPVVYTEYGAPSRELESVWIGLRPVINDVDFVIGRADASIAGLREVCGLAEDRRWAIVPNAVSAGPAEDAIDDVPSALDLPPDTEGVVITTIGRLSPEKGTMDVLAAFRRLVLDGLPVRLVLAGDGPLRPMLVSQTRSWSIEDRVTFTGVFEDLAPIMRRTHIVAHPTLNDGRSIAVLEAMAWGRPVVASDVGGVREIVADGVTGYLVPASDAAALAAALARLVQDPVARRAMGRSARAAFEAGGYTAEAMVARTLDIYAQVLAHAG